MGGWDADVSTSLAHTLTITTSREIPPVPPRGFVFSFSYLLISFADEILSTVTTIMLKRKKTEFLPTWISVFSSLQTRRSISRMNNITSH